MDTVTALCEITNDARIRISLTKTSFYGHGIDELREAIHAQLKSLPWIEPAPSAAPTARPVDRLELLLRRFHSVARQLRHRHAGRPTIAIQDEYDVQDLLHALLRSLYEDVRPEDPVPAHAGASSRVDFLLKPERTIVEAKFATANLRDRQIGEQLIIDIERYQAHPSCDRLVCFVYDPGSHIRNAAALEADLTGTRGRVSVRVVVVSP
jgi:hypothetical protein